MLPVLTKTLGGKGNVLMPGDYVEITACHCRTPHSRFGIIYSVVTRDFPNNDPRADFLVLLACGEEVATYCRPLELRPSTEDTFANALPRHLPPARQELILARR